MKTAEQKKIEKLEELAKCLKALLNYPNSSEVVKRTEDIESELAALDKEIEQGEEEQILCVDCKKIFPISYSAFNWDTGARRCLPCEINHLTKIIRTPTKVKADSDKRKVTEAEVKEEFEKLKQIVKDKYKKPISAQKWLQKKYPSMRGWRWNSTNIDDEWVAKQMEQYHKERLPGELEKAYNKGYKDGLSVDKSEL